MREGPIPDTLSDLQIWFARHITSPIKESDSSHIPLFLSDQIGEIRRRIAPSPHLTSEERLGIYQQQYWWRLVGICQEIFPSLVRLFGYGDFNKEIAEPYLLAHPPSDWFLSCIGDALPQWIQTSYLENDAPLVLELACLDLAYEKLLFTSLPKPIEPHLLAEYGKKKLFLQPCVLLFAFQADLFAFRTSLMEHPPEHWETHDFPSLEKKDILRYFVLHRAEEKNAHEEISAPLYTLLNRFQKGAKLADLLPLLETFEELLEAFQVMGQRGWLTFMNRNKAF